MDKDDLIGFGDLAIGILWQTCRGSRCSIGFGNFASQSLFLEFEDNEINEVLDYCVDSGYFECYEDNFSGKTQKMYKITFDGLMRLQTIWENFGFIKMIYYKKNPNIDLSKRILIYLNEQKSATDVGDLYRTFNNFNEKEIISTIHELVDHKLVGTQDDLKLVTKDEINKNIYSLFGTSHLFLTLNGKREAHKLLKDPEILELNKLPIIEDDKRLKIIEKILDSLRRFHHAANWLKERRKGHDPYIINDEYDVQDLLFSFLIMNFPETDVEDPSQRVATVSSRQDIIIQNLKLIIEIKHFKSGDTWSAMKKDIDSKIQTYSQKNNFDQIIIFIYNPDLALKNPDIIERDYTTTQSINGKEFKVYCIINPK